MDYFKIECQGAFKADRGVLLVGSVQDVVKRHDPDIVLVSSDADLIPTHRSLLGLYSHTLSEIVESVPCCQNVAVSVPFTSKTISSLLRLLASGVSNPVDQKSLASLTECAQVLGLSLQGLEIVEHKNVVTVEVGNGANIKSLIQNGGSVSAVSKMAAAPKMAAKIMSRGGIAPQKGKTAKSTERGSLSSKESSQRYSEDDIIEITPEMYAASSDYDADIAEREDDIMPHHFLMQGGENGYMENGGDSWNNHDENSWDVHDPKSKPMGHGVDEMSQETAGPDTSPEVNEVPSPEDPNVMVYTCSFCPGQYFKKRNDINRHLKKHVPIEMRKRFQCEKCKEKFINNSNLKVHMKVCTGKVKEFLCKKCGDVQYNKTDHLDHLARAHNIVKRHSCPICHKQLKKTSDLKKHMATHSNQKPFSCDVCGKKFKTESYVKVHMKSHFPDGQIPEHLLANLQQNGVASPSKTATNTLSQTDCQKDTSVNDGTQSPLSEDPRLDGLADSDLETMQDTNNISPDSDKDEDEDNLVIDTEECADNSAAMEFDETTDSPATAGTGTAGSPPAHLQLETDSPTGDDEVAESPDDADDDTDKKIRDQDLPVNDQEAAYPKKDLYVSQISLLRNSDEIL